MPMLNDLIAMHKDEWMDVLVVMVPRSDVESGDLSNTLDVLMELISTPHIAREYFERVTIAFEGYDDDPNELSEILEVRNFVYKLDDKFPFWLFFLSKRYSGLQCLLWCMLPPFLTEEAQARIYPERINDILLRRWFPAMNQICEYVGFTLQQNEKLTERVFTYITRGKFPLDSQEPAE